MATSELEYAMAGMLRFIRPRIAPPVTEYRFDDTRKWRFDFAWPELKLALEVEGGTWTGGRHVHPAGFERDLEKYNEATLQGWTVIRATRDQIDRGDAVVWVRRAVEALSA